MCSQPLREEPSGEERGAEEETWRIGEARSGEGRGAGGETERKSHQWRGESVSKEIGRRRPRWRGEEWAKKQRGGGTGGGWTSKRRNREATASVEGRRAGEGGDIGHKQGARRPRVRRSELGFRSRDILNYVCVYCICELKSMLSLDLATIKLARHAKG